MKFVFWDTPTTRRYVMFHTEPTGGYRGSGPRGILVIHTAWVCGCVWGWGVGVGCDIESDGKVGAPRMDFGDW